ncbi:hypothetical protein [Echinicola vietnamensis]|uniref:hypothetical protein n=1 Tax=Echinicola vietnamensis TaxID=390884 RepID=UPI0002F4C76D|nr:hypothetical protein [Echinicola vietnamensis]
MDENILKITEKNLNQKTLDEQIHPGLPPWLESVEAVSKVLVIAIPMDIGRSNLVIRAMKAHRDHFTPVVMTDYL